MTDSLLRIDVKAEIRKLTRQRFKSAGDYAVELLRWAAAQRPLRIDINISGSRFVISHDGQDLSGDTLKRLVTIFDPSRSSSQRHRAIVALEDQDGLGILAAFSLASGKTSVTGRVSGRRRGVEFTSSGMATSFDPGRGEGTTIVVRGRGRKTSLEKKLIEEACRYSLVPVRLNGERINKGPRLESSLVHVDLRNARLHGTIGLPLKSDLTRIVRLRNGIREEEKIRPPVNGMIFESIIDEKDDDLKASWGTLRRAGRRLYLRLGKRFDELDDQHRTRAQKLLFDRYEATSDAGLLRGVHAFRVLQGSPLDLNGVREWAQGRTLYAMDPSEPSRAYDVEGRRILRVDAMQRKFLERELDLELLPPPPRFGHLGALQRLRLQLRSLKKHLSQLFGGGPGRPVRDQHLDADEGAFLEAISAEIRSGGFSLKGEARPFGIRVRMAERQKNPWAKVERRDGRSEYRISREHPLVVSMIQAFAREPALIYPALIALTDGHDGYLDTRSIHQRAILTRYGLV